MVHLRIRDRKVQGDRQRLPRRVQLDCLFKISQCGGNILIPVRKQVVLLFPQPLIQCFGAVLRREVRTIHHKQDRRWVNAQNIPALAEGLEGQLQPLGGIHQPGQHSRRLTTGHGVLTVKGAVLVHAVQNAGEIQLIHHAAGSQVRYIPLQRVDLRQGDMGIVQHQQQQRRKACKTLRLMAD